MGRLIGFEETLPPLFMAFSIGSTIGIEVLEFGIWCPVAKCFPEFFAKKD
jgi:hypothetical protein